jgi:23S rRNA-/tRNA-specific pseudouridylate synthase
VCLVRGDTPDEFVVDKPLKDKNFTSAGKEVTEKVAREAVTSFEKIGVVPYGGFTLLRATLVSGGRTHQIRRHLNSLGNQIIGDKSYGKSGINKWFCEDFGLNRMFLHCESLVLTVGGEEIAGRDRFEDQEDLVEVWERFQKYCEENP